jgi:hypothetical protein
LKLLLENSSYRGGWKNKLEKMLWTCRVPLIGCVVKISLGRHIQLLTRINHGQQPGHGWGPKPTICFNLFWIRWMNRSQTWNAMQGFKISFMMVKSGTHRLNFRQVPEKKCSSPDWQHIYEQHFHSTIMHLICFGLNKHNKY